MTDDDDYDDDVAVYDDQDDVDFMTILNSDDEEKDEREDTVEDNKQILDNQTKGNFVEVDDYDGDYDGARNADDDMIIVQHPSFFIASYINVYHCGSPGSVNIIVQYMTYCILLYFMYSII